MRRTANIYHLGVYDPGTTQPNPKKKQRVSVIDGLNLTSTQKDILYLQKWKTSGLHKAPQY